MGHQAAQEGKGSCSMGQARQAEILGQEEGTNLGVVEDNPFRRSPRDLAGDHLGPMVHPEAGRTSDFGRNLEHQAERPAALAGQQGQDQIQGGGEP